ncbi:hypothetical protein LTR05_001285 [Lithohypha guttulata]|uniref:Uncharacterized protein n=1 Tax=Lithohypha guttulata TaxID=1690604 RepID=A0AAN7T7K2_9EURO|nr:hypothetical protein LTR05_001285 [Lithohypha guttulata]
MPPTLRPTRGGFEVGIDDFLDNFDPDDPEAIRDWEERYGDVDDDALFRSGSASLQQRQDLHLRLFLKSMKAYSARYDENYKDLTDDQIMDQEIRSASKETVLRNVRICLRDACFFTRGRAMQDNRPRYQTLIQHRNSMLFWVRREIPSDREFLNVANQTLQNVARRWGINKTRKVKTYMGHHELKQLIDYDTAKSPSMAVTESHHLAWCLGLICGVRPGSIGWSKNWPHQFLTFNEVQISRGHQRGVFNAKITFLYLKGDRDTMKAQDGLTFSVNGATSSDFLTASIPHRLLIMLLRRGGLQDHATLESLLQGNEHEVRVKSDFPGKPVCRAAGPRGLSITEAAVSGRSLSTFLADHAVQAGYPLGITMYSWRRKAATTWTRDLGHDVARQLMGHDLNSHTLEQYYEQGLYDRPVFEIAMRLDTQWAQVRLQEQSSEILRRMEVMETKRLRGAFVDRRVNEVLNENDEYQQAKQASNLKAMRLLERRARRLVTKFFMELRRREEALKRPGELVNRIRNAARNKLRNQATVSAAQRQPQQPVVQTPPTGTPAQRTLQGQDQSRTKCRNQHR